MPWDEQCKALVVLRKHPRVSRAYSHQVGITGNKRYSKANYPCCHTVIGQVDLHIVVEAGSNGSIGKGSANEIQHSLACERPVWLCDSIGDFLKFDEGTINKPEKDFTSWWVNDETCYGTFTHVIDTEFGKEERLSHIQIAKRVTRYNNEDYYY